MYNIYGKTLGYIFLFFVILITVASSIFIKSVYQDYPKPFAFTYINHSFLTILILIYFIKEKVKENSNIRENNKGISEEEKDLIDNNNGNTNTNEVHKSKISIYAIILLTVFWYLGNAFYNIGLSYDNISLSNSISNMAIIFILIEKVTCFKGKCSIYKILGVLFAFSGLTCITIYQKSNDDQSIIHDESLLGDLYILLGALFYSFYAVFLKHFSKKYSNFDMMLTFGLVGLFNFLLVPFLLIGLNFMKIEEVLFPSWLTIGKIFINALVASLISDLLQSYSVILLAPHIVSFGLILTIPLSITYDFLYPEKNKELKIDILFFLGTILLITSFVVVVYESYLKVKRKSENKKKERLENK